MQLRLPVLNLSEAKFECTFGRGCDGVCCREGRPPLEPDEIERIDANIDKFLPRLRPLAQRLLSRKGFVSGRQFRGQPTLRVADGWCIFFNRGCVLHQVGAEEGDKARYKPVVCSLFPLDLDDSNQWIVRQKGYKGEQWDLPCLDPELNSIPATESLRDELCIAEQISPIWQIAPSA